MKRSTYQHKNIIKIFPDLSPRSLVSWAEKEILIPGHSDARGRGTVRKYTFDNIVQAGIIRELMALGLTFRDIKTFVTDHWKNRMEELSYDCVLIFQRKMLKVNLKQGDNFELARHFDVRVFSLNEFNNYGADVILGSSAYEKNTNKLIPIGDQSSTISSALIINVRRIYDHVVNELN